jgi:hypothetical protein
MSKNRFIGFRSQILNRKKPEDIIRIYVTFTYYKGKGKFSLCVTKHRTMTLVLDGGESSPSRLGRFTPRESALGAHWIGGWVDPRAVLDAVVKRKISSPAGNRTLELRSFSP